METNKIKASLYNNQIISQTTNCPSFVSYIDEEIRKLSNAGRNGTAQNYKAAMNSFTKFIRNENFPLSSFTEEIVQKYEQIFIPEYDLLLHETIAFHIQQGR